MIHEASNFTCMQPFRSVYTAEFSVSSTPKMAADTKRSWIQHISKDQHRKLLTELLDIDTKNNVRRPATEADIVTEDDSYVWRIQQGIEEIIGNTGQGLKQKPFEFMGQSLYLFGGTSRFDAGGSFYNDCKVGAPNEMDFVYEWDITLFGPVALEECEPGVVEVLIGEGKRPLDGSQPKEWFKETVSELLASMSLPRGWSHGGFNRPNFSGLRVNGKVAFMVQLVYDDGVRAPLELTVDLVLLFKIDKEKIVQHSDSGDVTYPVLWTKLHKLGYDNQVWMMLLTYFWYPVSTMAQKAFMRQFPADHPLKKSIRIFKILTRIVTPPPTSEKIKDEVVPFDNTDYEEVMARLKSLNKTPADEKQISINVIRNFLVQCNVSEMQQHDCQAPAVDRWSTYGESVPKPEFVTSYLIQSLAMLLFLVDQEAGIHWTDDSIPHVLVNLLELLQRSTNLVQVSLRLHAEVYSPKPTRTLAEAVAAGNTQPHDIIASYVYLGASGGERIPLSDMLYSSMVNKLIKDSATKEHLDELMATLRRLAGEGSDRPSFTFVEGVELIEKVEIEDSEGREHILHSIIAIHDIIR